ncbi:hypothetical protein [Salinigranum marinum]|uniref:hypothetical protein n=1 Tax=Salinigranum marinum TaxID=1515595 RepID=UPI002989EB61|nr:hypothetical protein [Salinigranum marinum]
MPDDNRFAGLSEQVDGPADDDREAATDATDATNATDATDQEAAQSTSSGPDDGAGPAFTFDETTAKSIYARPETLTLLEDVEFEVETALRREHDVRDVTGREFHDAAVHVLAEHVDEIAARIDAARRE